MGAIYRIAVDRAVRRRRSRAGALGTDGLDPPSFTSPSLFTRRRSRVAPNLRGTKLGREIVWLTIHRRRRRSSARAPVGHRDVTRFKLRSAPRIRIMPHQMVHSPPMRRVALWALLGVAACGDNLVEIGEPLARSPKLIIVAHRDDDLLFMQPAVLEAVQSGVGVTTVYVTAGDDQRGVGYANKRYDGLRAAYGAAAGSTDWHCGWIELAGHSAQHCRLDD